MVNPDHLSTSELVVADYKPVARQFENGEFAAQEIRTLQKQFYNAIHKGLAVQLGDWLNTLAVAPAPRDIGTHGHQLPTEVREQAPVYAALAIDRSLLPHGVKAIQRLFTLALLFHLSRPKFRFDAKNFQRRVTRVALGVSKISPNLVQEIWDVIESHCNQGEWQQASSKLRQLSMHKNAYFDQLRRSELANDNPIGRKNLDGFSSQQIEFLGDLQRITQLFQKNRIPGLKLNKSQATEQAKRDTSYSNTVLATTGHNLRFEKRLSESPKDVLTQEQRAAVWNHLCNEISHANTTRSGVAALWVCVTLTSHGFDHLLQSLLPLPFSENPRRLIGLEITDGQVSAHIKMRESLKLAQIINFGDQSTAKIVLDLPEFLLRPLSNLRQKLSDINNEDDLQKALAMVFREKGRLRHALRLETNKRFNETRLRTTLLHALFHHENDIALTFLISGERLETSDAALNYIAWHHQQVISKWRQVIRGLYGLAIKFPALARGDELVGSQIAAALVSQNPKVGRLLPARPKLKPGPKTPELLIERINALALEAAQAFLIATTHRGSEQFNRITALDISLHRRIALIADKKVDLSLFRRPVFFNETTAVRLARYLASLKSLLRKYESDHRLHELMGEANIRHVQAAVDGTGSLFLMFDTCKSPTRVGWVSARDIWSNLISQVHDDPKLAWAETHRHVYSTKMREFGCPALLIEASMGHQAGPVFVGSGGIASPAEFQAELEPYLNQLLDWHGIAIEQFETSKVREDWLETGDLPNLTAGPIQHNSAVKADMGLLVERHGGPYDGKRRTAPQAVEEVFRALLNDNSITLSKMPKNADLSKYTTMIDGEEKTIIPIRQAKQHLIQMCGHDLALLKRSILLFRQTLNRVEADNNKGYPKSNRPWKVTRPHHQHWTIGDPVQFTKGRFIAEVQARQIRRHLLQNIELSRPTEKTLSAYLIACLICFAQIESPEHLDRVLRALSDAKRITGIEGVLAETEIELPATSGLESIREVFILTGPALLALCRIKRMDLRIPESAKLSNAAVNKLLPKGLQLPAKSDALSALIEAFKLNRLFEMPGLLADPLEARGVTRDLSLERYITIKTNTPTVTSEMLTEKLAKLRQAEPVVPMTLAASKASRAPLDEMATILARKLEPGSSTLAAQRIRDLTALIQMGFLSDHNERIATWLISLCHETANRKKLNEPIDDGTVTAYFQRCRILFDELQELDDGEWPIQELAEFINHWHETSALKRTTKNGYIKAIQRFCRDSKLPEPSLKGGDKISPKAAIRADFLCRAEAELIIELLAAHAAPLAPASRSFSPDYQTTELFKLSAAYGARRGELLGIEWRDCWQCSSTRYIFLHDNRKRHLKTDNAERIVELAEMKWELPRCHCNDTDRVFGALHDQGRAALSVMGHLIRAVSGSDQMRLHSNRHGIGSREYNACFDKDNSLAERAIALATLAQKIGHGSVETTRDFYGHMNSELVGRYQQGFEGLSLTRIAQISGVKRATVNKFASRLTSGDASLRWNQQLALWSDLPKIPHGARSFDRVLQSYRKQVATEKPSGAQIAQFVINATEVGIIRAAGKTGVHKDQLLKVLTLLKEHNALHQWQWISSTEIEALLSAISGKESTPSSELLDIGRIRQVDRQSLNEWLETIQRRNWDQDVAKVISTGISAQTWALGNRPATLKISYRAAEKALKKLGMPCIAVPMSRDEVELDLPAPQKQQRIHRTMIRIILMSIELAVQLEK